MARDNFQVDPHRTGVVLAYKNGRMIADEVLPRIETLSVRTFKYLKLSAQDTFTVPDTHVGRKGEVNQVEFSGKAVTDEVKDFALEDVIPTDEINVPGQKFDPRDRSALLLTSLIDLDRELEVAEQVFNADTYPTACKEVLSAADKFSSASSDPVGLIEDAVNKPLMRPTRMVIGQKAWSVLRRHPEVVSASYKNSGKSGKISLRDAEELFEVQISVGMARVNRARRRIDPEDETLPVENVWGPHVALLYQTDMPEVLGQTTFGFTAPYKTREAGGYPTNKGARGGEAVRVVESRKSVICAPGLGYFLQDVI